MKINYDSVQRWLEFESQINKLNLEDIEWVRDDGTVIKCTPELIKYFKFIGLSNISFAEMFLPDVIKGKEAEILKEFEDLESLTE